MAKRMKSSKLLLGSSFVGALLAGTLISMGVADSAPEGSRSEESTLTWDSEAESDLKGGVTIEEYEAALERTKQCMDPKASEFMQGPARDLSGLAVVYGFEAYSAATLDYVDEEFDRCYERIFQKIDMEYQLSVNDRVDEFYADFNQCVNERIGPDAAVSSPVVFELLPPDAAALYSVCLSDQ